MKVNRKVAILAPVVVLTIYIVSYAMLSAYGHYEPSTFGLAKGPNGETRLIPKACFGYDWHFAYLTNNKKELSPLFFIYAPLLVADRKFWHTSDEMETFKYPIRNYFDYHTFTYRDIDPK